MNEPKMTSRLVTVTTNDDIVDHHAERGAVVVYVYLATDPDREANAGDPCVRVHVGSTGNVTTTIHGPDGRLVIEQEFRIGELITNQAAATHGSEG